MEVMVGFDYRSYFFKSLMEIKSQCEDENYNGDINFELIGFIKEVAAKLDDVELQELANDIDSFLEYEYASTAYIEEEVSYENLPLKMENTYTYPYKQYAPEILHKLHDLFYKDKAYQVDMSDYREQIEENREVLKKADLYDHCARYVADAKAFSKLYHRVKEKLYNQSEMPTKEEFDLLVNESLDRIKVLANEFVIKNIKKAKSIRD